MKVYLSGGMRSGWQDKVIAECPGVEFIDPRDHGLHSSMEYTPWDLLAVRRCDIIFAYLEKDNPSGLGLALEVGYAAGLNKTIIFVNEKIGQRYTEIIDWTADLSYGTLELGIEYLKSFAKMESWLRR